MNQLPVLLALLPCGLRNAFKEKFYQKFPQYMVDCCEDNPQVLIEGNLNYEKSFYGDINKMTDTNLLPDIFISSDINALHHQHFIKNLLNSDFLEKLSFPVNSMYANVGYEHPEGLLTMLPPNLLIMVADERKFTPQDFPTRWSDLLRENLKQQLVLRGDNDFFCNALFFPYIRDYGFDAISRLAKNTLIGLHPAEMVKMINADNTDGASVFVMPYSFYLKIRKTDYYKLVWPKEGAIVSPVQMMVKKGAYKKHKDIIDFIMGEEMASAMIATGFPTTHNSIENTTPHTLNWLSWEYIYKNDIESIKQKTQEIFFASFEKKRSKKKTYTYLKQQE